MSRRRGGFTLPGEAGYEDLTLKLAEKWGADVIRDSDGTKLSEEIMQAGYGIYSTVCVIRDHNEWAKKNTDKLQQTFLCTNPAIAAGQENDVCGLRISLLADFFEEQFAVNDSDAGRKYWQVYDRTANTLLSEDDWSYEEQSGSVIIPAPCPWHKYTVSFLAYRIWEEISMYNHTTNNWDKEHLMQIDPRYPETREYLRGWMKEWCESHPATTVVRFTSLFYNFVWIWGADPNCRNLFTDWGSYDFTVSERALNEFEEEYGYALTAEDFINKNKRHVTHMPGDKQKQDWMEFVNDFVISFGRELIDIVHSYGKKAYVFYDDSWVGLEPYNGRFGEFGFDGLIKCVFSGYEARLCAGVDVPVHELRLHPYLFPVGLGGAPTFMDGGNPTEDAKKYWINIRRALLRCPVDRIGLGGYLHLTENFPDFCDYIEQITDEFHMIQDCHVKGKPYCIKTKVAVLHSWGALRSWTLSGHFHETYQHELIHINEALSGLPVAVRFLSFEDVKNGKLKDVDMVINAGYAGSAWSGGDAWKDDELVEILTKWVYEGGTFLGVNEPSAVEGYDTYFRMAHVLGIDEDTGERICHGKWNFQVETIEKLIPDEVCISTKSDRYLTDGTAKVLMEENGTPVLSVHDFGKGKGIYLSSFTYNNVNTRFLYQIIQYAGNEENAELYMTDNVDAECAYYPESSKLIVVNNSDKKQQVRVNTETGIKEFLLMPYEARQEVLKIKQALHLRNHPL